MKILHVAESAKGGVGTYLRELAALQTTTLGSANVQIVAPDDHCAQLGHAAACTVTYARPDRSVASLSALASAVGEAVEAFHPDVIHIHSTFAGLVVRALFGWRRNRPQLVYCPHGWAFDIQGNAASRAAAVAMELALATLCDRVVAVSLHEARLARRIGIPAGKIDIVANGLAETPPTAVAQTWDDPRLKVLFIGRLDRQKGVDTLLDAVEPLQNRLCVRVIGDAVAGGARPRPVSAVERLGWHGPAELQGHIDLADVVVMPSRWEAFGLVALEAMRAGRMVIATNVGGLPEIVDHGGTGWLVPPNSPAALGRALLAARYVDRDAMGANGRRRFQAQFTADRMHNRLLDVYRAPGAATFGTVVPAFS